MGRALIRLVLVFIAAASASPAAVDDPATTRELDVAGELRRYHLFAPPDAKRAPLVITLHGHGQTAKQIEAMSGWTAVAARHGAVVAYPLSRGERWRIFGPRSPDVEFLVALIDQLAADGLVDPARVFVNGYSGGAQMSWRFACQEPTRVVAAGFVAGAAPDGCGLGDKPPVILFHGERDSSLPFMDGQRTLDIPSLGQAWAAREGCQPTATIEVKTDPKLRAEGVRRHHWACDADAPVLLYSFRRGEHDWPGHARSHGSRSVDATAVMWEFFQAHAPAR